MLNIPGTSVSSESIKGFVWDVMMQNYLWRETFDKSKTRADSLNFPICNPVLHLVSVALKLKHFKAFFFFWKYNALNKGGKKHPPWHRHSRGHRIFKVSKSGVSCSAISQHRTDLQPRIHNVPFMSFIKVFLHDSYFSFISLLSLLANILSGSIIS